MTVHPVCGYALLPSRRHAPNESWKPVHSWRVCLQFGHRHEGKLADWGVAGGYVAHGRADGFDESRALVAEDHRKWDRVVWLRICTSV